MDGETILKMDSNMALSIVNMKLRDAYGSLSSLCDDLDMSEKEIMDKLKEIGYTYNEDTNQFIGL